MERPPSPVPAEGRGWAGVRGGAPVIAEAAILFTDVRRSTALAAELPAPALFAAINDSLSGQAAIVREWGGAVIKFTGDGLMAEFLGRGRSHFALRCALALQARLATARLRIGVGVAEGLVMKGLLGEPGNQLFDVIGATVHLAARLCSAAHEHEVVATPKLVRAAGLPLARAEARSVRLRGFEKLYECVFIPPPPGGPDDGTAIRR